MYPDGDTEGDRLRGDDRGLMLYEPELNDDPLELMYDPGETDRLREDESGEYPVPRNAFVGL